MHSSTATYPVACFDSLPTPGIIIAAAKGKIQTNQALVAPISSGNPKNSVAII
jgi:hypothetical protein